MHDLWGEKLGIEKLSEQPKKRSVVPQYNPLEEIAGLKHQNKILQQELQGLRGEFIAYRREIANLMNALKEDVSTRLLNFTSFGEFLQYKQEIQNILQERLGE